MYKGFSIRKATKKDHLQVKGFIELVDNEFCPPLSKRGGGIAERINRSLDTAESDYLVAVLKEICPSDVLKGFLGMIGYTRKWKRDDAAYINFLATHPGHRNHGISKALCTTLEEHLLGEDIHTVYVCTWSTNPAAMRSYEELGYNAYSSVLDDRGKGVDTIYYKKRI